MGQFDSAIELADRLITKNGMPITLRHRTLAAAASDTPWEPGAATVTDTTVDGVFLNYNRKDVDGDVIKQGDQYVYIAAKNLSSVPSIDDLLIRDTEVWKIVNIEELRPNSQRILYTAQVRQ